MAAKSHSTLHLTSKLHAGYSDISLSQQARVTSAMTRAGDHPGRKPLVQLDDHDLEAAFALTGVLFAAITLVHQSMLQSSLPWHR